MTTLLLTEGKIKKDLHSSVEQVYDEIFELVSEVVRTKVMNRCKVMLILNLKNGFDTIET